MAKQLIPVRPIAAICPPLQQGDKRHHSYREGMVDDNVQNSDDRDEQPITEKIRVKNREVHRSSRSLCESLCFCVVL